MTRLALRTLLATTAVVLTCAGCASSSGKATPTTGQASVATSSAPTTTVAPTTTLPPKATEGATSSSEAAAALVAAWEAHDRVAASKVADAEAVEGIFATPDPAMWIRGCTTDDSLPEGGCIYRTANGGITINTEKRDIGWVVTTADYAPIAPLG